ncbi:hypothetical protein [Actinoplanes xinjiangensis]|uniref:hypothetical protein n=1 Tax=Actinoplanes xinjiangensis TaxID=512350 RepID=UPI00342DFB98
MTVMPSSTITREQPREVPLMSVSAPRRTGERTYVLDGRERYADTGRPVDEQLGSHVMLWVVDAPVSVQKPVCGQSSVCSHQPHRIDPRPASMTKSPAFGSGSGAGRGAAHSVG